MNNADDVEGVEYAEDVENADHADHADDGKTHPHKRKWKDESMTMEISGLPKHLVWNNQFYFLE